ncbi:hypothetical protein DUNSADRAFT_18138 [Dunaliella salina]|uniref:Uncharacterized protein n=1 Tax=Dunaliella salina TaxID=3046 RepID=A0ABQ7GZD7_DUNSA|nr:hypothetical protein DUNSADRAFT_18138 [Dunaliella salina]|eukprot:KAF5839978.1 hypothetical protein DUNSADRAFT_18138 [Dunaliella salina]
MADFRGQQLRRSFLPSMGFFIICLIALMFGLTNYCQLSTNAQDEVTRYYTWFIHVEIMVFVGFGLLMTFLRRYSLGAVMLNFLGSCLIFLVAILIVGAAQQVPAFALNQYIVIKQFHILDMGGSNVIHLFGCY